MSFVSGSRCWILPVLAEKQPYYVIFHRTITGDRPVFFLGALLTFQFIVFHAIRVSDNLEYSGMMDQTVKNGGCHGTVLKNVSPFRKGDIGYQDGRMYFVP